MSIKTLPSSPCPEGKFPISPGGSRTSGPPAAPCPLSAELWLGHSEGAAPGEKQRPSSIGKESSGAPGLGPLQPPGTARPRLRHLSAPSGGRRAAASAGWLLRRFKVTKMALPGQEEFFDLKEKGKVGSWIHLVPDFLQILRVMFERKTSSRR